MLRKIVMEPRIRSLVGVSLVLLAIMLLVAACGSSSEPTAAASPTQPANVGDPAGGEQIFAANCASCHGPDATGGALGPSLVRAEAAAQPDDWFREAIVNGRAGSAMPAWEDILSAQEIEDVIAFLRSKQ